MKELSELCPQHPKCSVNNCPLYSKYPDMPVSEIDPETKCKAQKPTRMKIADEHPGILKFGGLTVKEYKRKIRRENRTAEEVERAKEKMARIRKTKDFKVPMRVSID